MASSYNTLWPYSRVRHVSWRMAAKGVVVAWHRSHRLPHIASHNILAPHARRASRARLCYKRWRTRRYLLNGNIMLDVAAGEEPGVNVTYSRARVPPRIARAHSSLRHGHCTRAITITRTRASSNITHRFSPRCCLAHHHNAHARHNGIDITLFTRYLFIMLPLYNARNAHSPLPGSPPPSLSPSSYNRVRAYSHHTSARRSRWFIARVTLNSLLLYHRANITTQ